MHNVNQLTKTRIRTTNTSVRMVTVSERLEKGASLKHQYQVFLVPKDPEVVRAYGLEPIIGHFLLHPSASLTERTLAPGTDVRPPAARAPQALGSTMDIIATTERLCTGIPPIRPRAPGRCQSRMRCTSCWRLPPRDGGAPSSRFRPRAHIRRPFMMTRLGLLGVLALAACGGSDDDTRSQALECPGVVAGAEPGGASESV